MMPGARFFLLSHGRPFILPDGRAGRADYNRLRRAACSPHPPRGPLFVLLYPPTGMYCFVYGDGTDPKTVPMIRNEYGRLVPDLGDKSTG